MLRDRYEASLSSMDPCQPPSPPVEAQVVGLVAPCIAPSSSTAADPRHKNQQLMLEMRRKRNRESMQRARQKQRNRVANMNNHLRALSIEFDQLLQQKPVLPQTTEQHERLASLQTAYTQVVETSHRLTAEKFLLQRMLEEQERMRAELKRAVASYNSFEAQRKQQETAEDDPMGYFQDFVRLSPAEALAIIRCSHQHILKHEKMAKPLNQFLADAGNPSRTFGWSVQCEMSVANHFFVTMSKRILGVSADVALERSWLMLSRPRRTDKCPSRRIVRSVVLQQINDDTCVLANDWHHPAKPGVIMRTMSLRSKVATKTGVAIAQGSVTPISPELRCTEALEYMDVFTWYHFVPDPDDSSNCIMTLRTLSQFNTLESVPARLLNGIGSMVRWETDVLRSGLKVLAL